MKLLIAVADGAFNRRFHRSVNRNASNGRRVPGSHKTPETNEYRGRIQSRPFWCRLLAGSRRLPSLFTCVVRPIGDVFNRCDLSKHDTHRLRVYIGCGCRAALDGGVPFCSLIVRKSVVLPMGKGDL